MNGNPGSNEAPQREKGPFPVAQRALDLRELGIDKEQAADLRARLNTFAEDWERPEMDVYDA
jgi:hypothetical protein